MKSALQLQTCDVCLLVFVGFFFMTEPPVLIFFSFLLTPQGPAADRGNVGRPSEEDSW